MTPFWGLPIVGSVWRGGGNDAVPGLARVDYPTEVLSLVRLMSSMIASDSVNSAEATERVIERMSRTKDNEEFLATLTKEV